MLFPSYAASHWQNSTVFLTCTTVYLASPLLSSLDAWLLSAAVSFSSFFMRLEVNKRDPYIEDSITTLNSRRTGNALLQNLLDPSGICVHEYLNFFKLKISKISRGGRQRVKHMMRISISSFPYF